MSCIKETIKFVENFDLNIFLKTKYQQVSEIKYTKSSILWLALFSTHSMEHAWSTKSTYDLWKFTVSKKEKQKIFLTYRAEY